MNITTVKYMKRKNLGNYEHEEISVDAVLAEGESAELALVKLKEFVTSALNGTLGKDEAIQAPTLENKLIKEEGKPAPSEEAKSSVEGEVPPVIEQPARAATKRKAASPDKGTTEAASKVLGSVDTKNVTTVQSEGTQTSTPVKDKNVVTYDASIKEHRSRLATFLGKEFPNWKTAKTGDEIKEFSSSLAGLAFEDTKGNMLDSFKTKLSGFFGN